MFNFGVQLRKLRQSRKLTQKQVATSIGVTENGFQNYERGVRKPTYEVLIALGDYFGVSIDYLVGRTDDPINPTITKAIKAKSLRSGTMQSGGKYQQIDSKGIKIPNSEIEIEKDYHLPPTRRPSYRWIKVG